MIENAPIDDLPAIVGLLAELEARARLRLTRPPAATPVARLIDAAEAATIAGTSKRWILSRTRGMKFRCDLSQKQPRFQEAGLRAWVTGRR